MAESKYLGNHFWLAPEAVGTSTITIKPGTGSFTKIGECGSFSVRPGVTVKEIMQPSPGQMRRGDVIPISAVLDVHAHVVQVSPVFWQLLWNTLALVVGANQYNPGEGLGLLKGWVKVQQYDQANALYNTVDLWAALTIDSDVSFGESPVEYDITARIIQSTLNTGSFVTLA